MSVKTIAVTGGKGGVGKSNVAVNLATVLGSMGQAVTLIDADFGLANIDVLLGLTPKFTLNDFFSGACEIKDLLLLGPNNIHIVPGGSGIQSLTELNSLQQNMLIQALSYSKKTDVLIIDTAAGIGRNVTQFACACQEILIVLCHEPTSLADAYALIKVLSRQPGTRKFRILCNQVNGIIEGQHLFDKLLRTTDRFLDVHLTFEGIIPFDDAIRKAVRRQKSVVTLFPKSNATAAFNSLACRVQRWQPSLNSIGGLQFFFENLVIPHSESA
ncbi:MAG: MinD/ParA family protein [Pseudomonadota bacterium]